MINISFILADLLDLGAAAAPEPDTQDNPASKSPVAAEPEAEDVTENQEEKNQTSTVTDQKQGVYHLVLV